MSKELHFTAASARGRATLVASALAILASVDCVAGTPTAGEPTEDTLTTSTLTATPATPLSCADKAEAACPNTRWIAIKTDADVNEPCPLDRAAFPGWTVQQLFRSYSAIAIRDIPRGLRPYCLYEGTPGTDVFAPLAGNSDVIESAAKDCLVVAPLATTHPPGYWEYLAGRFYFHAGAAEGATAGVKSNVRLAFIDTGPTNPDTPQLDTPLIGTCPLDPFDPDFENACSPHGHALVNMALGLLCGPGAIPDSGAAACGDVSVRSSLGLSYVNRRGAMIERKGGGVAGFLGDVAAAIETEVDNWSGPGIVPEERLIVNLSLGWAPCYGGYESDATRMVAPVQAVHAAIRDAACRGALVVAAGGNFAGLLDVVGGVELQGSILPAHWEGLAGYPMFGGDLQCGGPMGAVFPEQAAPATDLIGTKAVYAIGGLRPDGRPLVNSRPKSFRRFAAFADHAVVGDPASTNPTGTLSGSSVASMVVSTTAAAIWSRNPVDADGLPLSAGEVMDLIYANSRSLVGRVDPAICAPDATSTTTPCDVRAVKLCQVVNAAVPGASLPCLMHRPKAPDVSKDLCKPGGPIRCLTVPTPDTVAAPSPPCRGEFHAELAGATPPCAHWQFTAFNATPWGGSQPGDNPCPGCGHKPGSGALLIDMDPNFTVEGEVPVFTDAALVFGPEVADLDWDGSTGASVYPLGAGTLAPDTHLVACLGDLEIPQEDSLLLTMTVTAGSENRTIAVPVMRFPPDPNIGDLCPDPPVP